MEETLRKTKAASRILATISDEKRNEILLAVADAIISNKDRILKANADDLAKMDPKNPLYDNLYPSRIIVGYPKMIEGSEFDEENAAIKAIGNPEAEAYAETFAKHLDKLCIRYGRFVLRIPEQL